MNGHSLAKSRVSNDAVDPGMNLFARNVLKVMESVEYRLCEDGEDLEDIYRLRYRSYLNGAMIDENRSRMIVDEFDELPHSYCYGVYYDGHLVSTVRLHHITPDMTRSPSVKVFGDILEPRLLAGESFIDPSRFAADPEWGGSLRVLPYITLRIPMLACHFFETNACLQAIKEEHSAFYKRVFVAEPLVRARAYPGLTCLVDLWQSPSPLVWQQAMERFAFFRSTLAEERMLFTKPSREYRPPLTILPSAKYTRRAA